VNVERDWWLMKKNTGGEVWEKSEEVLLARGGGAVS